MATKHAVIDPAGVSVGRPAAGSHSLWERSKIAAAVPVLLLGVLVSLPFALLVCATQVRVDEELQDRGLY